MKVVSFKTRSRPVFDAEHRDLLQGSYRTNFESNEAVIWVYNRVGTDW